MIAESPATQSAAIPETSWKRDFRAGPLLGLGKYQRSVPMAIFIVVMLAVTLVNPLSAEANSIDEYQRSATAEDKASALTLKIKAEKGDAESQLDLSKAYMQGIVFKRNSEAAVKWARAAALQGLSDAQLNLGTFYYVGAGVPQDYALARYWTQKSAEQNNAKAEQNMGVFYAYGQGVKKIYISL